MEKAALVLLVLAAALGRQEERVVERSFESELELATERFELSGSEDGRTEEQHPPDYVREQAEEIELVDTLLDEEDPPLRFTRLYRSLATSFRIGTEQAPLEKTGTPGLEGLTVAFEREDDGSYARSCADEGVRPVQLERLRADVSLACFLPGADEGAEPDAEASWEIPCAHLARLVAPVEERVRRRRANAPRPEGGLNLAPAALSEPLAVLFTGCEGTFTATPLERGGEDELPRRARLEFRLTSTHDGSESLLAGYEAEEAEDELTLAYEGTGTLAWDPDDGRIEIECEGELRLSERFEVTVEGNGKTGEVRGELVLVGRYSLSASEQRGE